MKNKNTIITIVLIFGVALFFIMLMYYSNSQLFNQRLFILKHVSYFLLMTFITILVLFTSYRLVYDLYKKKFQNPIYLKLFTLLLFTITIILVSNQRINYINEFETPHKLSYYIYDDYGNRIYNGKIKTNDPVIEVIEKTDNYLELSITETTQDTHDRYTIDEEDHYNVLFEVEIKALIKITYDDLNRITKFESIQAYNEVTTYRGVNYYDYTQYYQIVENTYSDGGFQSVLHRADYGDDEYHDYFYDIDVSFNYYVSTTSVERVTLNDFVITYEYAIDYENTQTEILYLTQDSWGSTSEEFYIEHEDNRYYYGVYDNYIKAEVHPNQILLMQELGAKDNSCYREYEKVDDLFLLTEYRELFFMPNYETNITTSFEDTYITLIGDMESYFKISKEEYGYLSTQFIYITEDMSDTYIESYKNYPYVSGRYLDRDYLDYKAMMIDSPDYRHLIYEPNPIYDVYQK